MNFISNDIINIPSLHCSSRGGATHVATALGIRSLLIFDEILVFAGWDGGGYSLLSSIIWFSELSGGYLSDNVLDQSAKNLPFCGCYNQDGYNNLGNAFCGMDIYFTS